MDVSRTHDYHKLTRLWSHDALYDNPPLTTDFKYLSFYNVCHILPTKVFVFV